MINNPPAWIHATPDAPRPQRLPNDAAMLWLATKIAVSLLLLDALFQLIVFSDGVAETLQKIGASPSSYPYRAPELEPWQLLFVIFLHLYAAVTVAFNFEMVSWFYERYVALHRLGRQPSFPARWAVFAFLIPLVHLVLPAKIAKELWTESLPDDEEKNRGSASSARVEWVWGLWVLSYLMLVVSGAVLFSGFRGNWLANWLAAYLCVDLVASVATLPMIGEVERRQRARWQAWVPAGEDPRDLPAFLPMGIGPRQGARVLFVALFLQQVLGGLAVLKGVTSSALLSLLIAQVAWCVAPLWVLHNIRPERRRPLGARQTRWGLGELAAVVIGCGHALLWLPVESIARASSPNATSIYSQVQEEIGFYGFMCCAVILAPLVEELAFRGVMLQCFRTRFGPAISVLVVALIFAWVHPYLMQRVAAFLVGCLCGAVRLLSGSLWPAICLHAASNLVILVGPRVFEDPSSLYALIGLTLVVVGLAATMGFRKVIRRSPPPAALVADSAFGEARQ